MTQDPDNLVLELLREIRAKLADHDKRFDANELRFDALDQRFEELNKKIDDWQETTATANGLATHANLRNARIEEQIADLARRVEMLEGAK